MSFRVGQKVVCVDAGPTSLGYLSGLEDGRVYSVSGFHAKPDCYGVYGVYLHEVLPKSFPGHTAAFRPSRFRPAVERKTDISIFTAMLDPSKQKVTI